MPTDPKYRNLNIVQKLTLLYAIDKEKFDNLEITKNMFEEAKMYMNPQLYKQEYELTHNTDTNHINAEYDETQKRSRAAGKLVLSDETRKAVERFKQEFQQEKNKQVHKEDTSGELG